MQPRPWSTLCSQNVSSVGALVDQSNEKALCHRFGGDRPGLNELFAANSPIINADSRRLAETKTLLSMRGHLCSGAVDLQDSEQSVDAAKQIPNVSVDDMSVFPDTELTTAEETDLYAGYWADLRLCCSH